MDLTLLEILFMGISASVTGFCGYKIGQNSSKKEKSKNKKNKQDTPSHLYDISVLTQSMLLKVGDKIPAFAFHLNLSNLQTLKNDIQHLKSATDKLQSTSEKNYHNFIQAIQNYATTLKQIKNREGTLSERVYVPDFIYKEFSLHKIGNYLFISDGKHFYTSNHPSLSNNDSQELSLRAGNILSQLSEISKELKEYTLMNKNPDKEVVEYTEARIYEAEEALINTIQEIEILDEFKEAQIHNEHTIKLMDKSTKMTF